MNDYIALACTFTLSHLPFVMLIVALLLGLWQMSRHPEDRMEGLIAYTLLLAVGLSGIWGFVMHAFYPQIADKFIGWAWSPFEYEVAVANLGMGLTGIFAFNASHGFRLATILFATCFGWGAAGGHLYQMLNAHNFNPGNAGLIFYTDILIPLLLWIFVATQNRKN